MKVKRLKKASKHLNFYVNNYKFFAPYQILIDGTFTQAALQNKFNIEQQMPKYFQSEIKLLTTQCVIVETEKLGPKLYGASLIVKKFAVHICGHGKKTVSGSECLRSMVGAKNESRYIVATQDRLLQDQLRNVPGCPVMYLHGVTPTLEAPSPKDKEHLKHLLDKIIMSEDQEKTLQMLKKNAGIVEEEVIKKKKKIKGPNPLSVKKKLNKSDKANTGVQATNNDRVDKSGKVKKRKRVKLPAHVKEALKSS
ncbi:hypothetical protein TKK_0005000 [Trichogramma kaykai]|uniref:rRNA-processing protein UTP23 homolog n=1 Tax=Trichogramma kaykai TaxID=54128 RepID=A0ABD2XJ87_9HYME